MERNKWSIKRIIPGVWGAYHEASGRLKFFTSWDDALEYGNIKAAASMNEVP